MDTSEFINITEPEVLYLALEPVRPPRGAASCAVHDAERFASPKRQQAAFDGEPVDRIADYRAARAMCIGCPILAACRRYAEESCEEYTFLGGLSPEQRRDRPSKKNEIAKRRMQVSALRDLGAPTNVIAELVGRDPSLVRGDLRAVSQLARPAM